MGRSPDAVKRQLDAMARTKDMYGSVGAWKCYPAWSPQNTEWNAPDGYFLDDETPAFVHQQGLELGVGTSVSKWLPIPGFSTRYNDPVDIGASQNVSHRQSHHLPLRLRPSELHVLQRGRLLQWLASRHDSLITSLIETASHPGAMSLRSSERPGRW